MAQDASSLHLSVVIPNYNGEALLRDHLPSILAQLEKGDELIVVDDASTDHSVEMLYTEFPMVTVLRNYENKRFGVTCNLGVQLAQNELVVLFNSDVKPLKGCLSRIREVLGSASVQNSDLFGVGCLEIDKRKRESGRGLARFERGMMIHRRAKNQYNPHTLWLTGGSMAVRKSLWNKLGGFDPAFRPAYEEDRDLSYRALKRGYRIQFLYDAKVLHNHATTNKSALGQRRIQVASIKNTFLFHWKNLTDPRFIFLHLLWMPYHLLIGSFKTKGAFLEGWFWAVLQLDEVIGERMKAKGTEKRSDPQILSEFGVE